MKIPFARSLVLALVAFLGPFSTAPHAAAVAVHDPSVVIAYKDASGNTYPANDAGLTRTKYYYVFGTMLGAAYSTDMIDWTSFTPSMTTGTAVSTDYYALFKSESDYAEHTTSADVLGNLWAPDVVWNTSLQKWCMYISLSGVAFKSSIIMLVADKIEGPYKRIGDVVLGGFTKSDGSIGWKEYNKVTGATSVAARFLTNGAWNNDYAVSAIDPAVSYDQSGKLWMVYGSWSGGLFLLKLSESTGLRDYSYSYGFTTDPVWNGTTLRYDKYMGIHLGGGYYVSGEGPYIRYLQDPDGGNGYYYLFESMGFYSPEGGYTMRVFRSPTIDGTYTDVTGDNAAFSKWVENFGANVTYGFPIVQNHKWSWWTLGEIAQGHNSVLRDEDGSAYLVYHRKFDNGTAWHNVEVHQLHFNDKGWVLAAPFEYRQGYGLRKTAYTAEDLAGTYGVISHEAVDYANLATNAEKRISINADGTVTGAYAGTWTYAFSNGRQFLTLTTGAGTYRGVLADQLMNDTSTQTISFTAMNPANERGLWGYRIPRTGTSRTTRIDDHSLLIGNADTTLAWNAYDEFRKDTVSGDFEVEYEFVNNTKAAENWHNWALALVSGTETWYLRSDAFSNSIFTGTTVNHKSDWNGAIDYKQTYRNKRVRLKVSRIGTTIDVFAFVDSTLVYTASAINAPTGQIVANLGGENVLLDVSRVTTRSLGARKVVGRVNDDGTYTTAFNSVLGDTTKVAAGDFQLRYRFANYHNPTSVDNWDNYILRVLSGTSTMLMRADAFAMDAIGTVSFSYDWDWAEFLKLVSGATIDLTIQRSGSTITYSTTLTARDGTVRHCTATQTGAPTTAISFGFTNEESMVDLFEVERVQQIGQILPVPVTPSPAKIAKAPRFYTRGRALMIDAPAEGVATLTRIDGRTSRSLRYHAGTNRYADLEPGLYFAGRQRLLVP